MSQYIADSYAATRDMLLRHLRELDRNAYPDGVSALEERCRTKYGENWERYVLRSLSGEYRDTAENLIDVLRK